MKDQVAARMLTILVDHNIEGQARRLWGMILAEGWLALMPMRMVTLATAGLAGDATTRRIANNVPLAWWKS